MSVGESAAEAGLDEIRAVMADLPGADLEAGTAALTRQTQLKRSGGSLGRLGDQVQWLATWQGRHPPSLRRPRTAVFAGNHGIAAHLGEAAGKGRAEALVRSAVDGGAAVNAVCTIADADLRVFEMSLETPTLDSTVQPAMSEEECARAIAYGMMAVEQGLDLLCLDTVGDGSDLAAGALSFLLFGGSPSDWTAAALEQTVAESDGLIDMLGALHRGSGDAFEALRRLGGYETCAVTGAIIAARLARTPIVLGGYGATAAAGVLFAFDRRSIEHCRAAEAAPLPGGHARLQERLGLQPLMDYGSKIGAGTEATLAVLGLKAAVEIHVGMAPALR